MRETHERHTRDTRETHERHTRDTRETHERHRNKSNQIKSKSNQIKSNQIESNQIKSNQINHIKSNQFKVFPVISRLSSYDVPLISPMILPYSTKPWSAFGDRRSHSAYNLTLTLSRLLKGSRSRCRSHQHQRLTRVSYLANREYSIGSPSKGIVGNT